MISYLSVPLAVDPEPSPVRGVAAAAAAAWLTIDEPEGDESVRARRRRSGLALLRTSELGTRETPAESTEVESMSFVSVACAAPLVEGAAVTSVAGVDDTLREMLEAEPAVVAGAG